MPDKNEKLTLLKNRLARYSKKVNFTQLLPKINGLSHAEISLACLDAIKETVLNDKQQMNNHLILRAIKDRNAAYNK